MHAPESFPSRILLALGGMSPQVVTETLYHLCKQRTPPFIPTEVHLITTTAGREESIDGLLDDDGKFHDFVKDFGLEGQIRFTIDHLHVITDSNGAHLADIRTESDNIAAADLITERIRKLTSDAGSALHVSISGGRNTLGFYLGYALSMFGRPQDRLSHVLVSQEFEGNDDFYYPPPQPELISTRSKGRISTHHAKITLAEIPFVSLRHGLPKALLEGKATYSQTVEAIRRALAPPSIRIGHKTKSIWCGDVLVEMPPQLFAFYAWMAWRRKNRTENNGHISWRDTAAGTEYLDIYRSIVGEDSHDYEAVVENFTDGMPREFFEEKKTRTNKWIKELIGPAAEPYLLVSSGSRPHTRFGLSINTDRIQLS